MNMQNVGIFIFREGFVAAAAPAMRCWQAAEMT
jgi:hypothetical protein